MAQLTMAQIGDLAEAAWGDDAPRTDAGRNFTIVQAVAIAWAESKGDTIAHNTTPPDDSYGLWQINMYGSMGPRRRTQLGLSSDDQLFDPATNARAAHQVWKDAGGSFKPWSTFTSGAYTSYVPEARTALGNTLGSPPTYDTWMDALADGVVGIAQTVWKSAVWVSNPHNWGRVIVTVLGGALVVGALVVVAKPNTTVVDAVTAAPKAAARKVTG